MRHAAALCALLLAAAGPAGPWQVSTDTLQYCNHLARRAATYRHAGADAQHLAHEGAEMCDHGAIRAGIAKLRYALALMRADHAAPHR